ncbi:MAG: bifunctional 3-deoxy-7-phosphoheptulonate synthase/chorismate mutase [Bacteroidetes bacterium]|nr:bifunctional 3-deoxy-7-phosphoheptulonate synthase/chorismate mutase [Bacteroidota bacterium]
MIIILKKDTAKERIKKIASELQAAIISNHSRPDRVLVTPSALKNLKKEFLPAVENYFVFDDDIQLASRKFMDVTREVNVGGITIGGHSKNTLVITGPCSVESEEQIMQSGQLCKQLGVLVMRAGAFKPRTSPYTFQGLGIEGLKLLDKVRKKFGLKIITEVRDATHLEPVIEYADIIQIGAKSMYDHGILNGCAKTRKPVLLKRGFGTTLQEFVQAAEFILSGGNENLILCERGIRTFETKTRFTLDLCGVAYLKKHVNLPVVVDPSHAIGYSYGVADLARAAMAMGVDGLLIETHPNPSVAKSDASQQLNHKEFTELYSSLKAVAKAVGRNVV